MDDYRVISSNGGSGPAAGEDGSFWEGVSQAALKGIRASDIVFLNHEYNELTIMKETGYNYERRTI